MHKAFELNNTFFSSATTYFNRVDIIGLFSKPNSSWNGMLKTNQNIYSIQSNFRVLQAYLYVCRSQRCCTNDFWSGTSYDFSRCTIGEKNREIRSTTEFSSFVRVLVINQNSDGFQRVHFPQCFWSETIARSCDWAGKRSSRSEMVEMNDFNQNGQSDRSWYCLIANITFLRNSAGRIKLYTTLDGVATTNAVHSDEVHSQYVATNGV